MLFFLDSANLEEIQDIQNLGILDGITTNPSLIAKLPGVATFKDTIKEIVKLVAGPISAEVIAVDEEGMLKEARELAALADNIVVKIPLTEAGLKVVQILTKEGIQTNVTLCFSVLQALLVGRAGATYVSPFMGRLDDTAHNGVQLIGEIRAIYDNYNIQTKILAASIRHPIHVKEAALIGIDVVTASYKILKQMYKHPNTDLGLQDFLEASKKFKWG